MNKLVIGIFGLLIVASVIVLSGCTTGTIDKVMVDEKAVDINAMEKIDDNTMTNIDAETMEKKEDTMMENTETMMAYSGIVLSGTKTPYIEFNQEDYDNAIADGKTVLLNFYANWCPSCNDEDSVAKDAFDQLDNNNVVGFRVNYKDSNTEPSETELAKEFGIAYQHTKVIIKDGAQLLKSPESWDTQRYLSEIAKYS